MDESEFDLDMDELSSAEDFLDYFKLEYDQKVVHVNRLHILQRFHDYIEAYKNMPEEDENKKSVYADLLKQAYQDFVESDAQTEKVFQVFKMGQPSVVNIPISDIDFQAKPNAT